MEREGRGDGDDGHSDIGVSRGRKRGMTTTAAMATAGEPKTRRRREFVGGQRRDTGSDREVRRRSARSAWRRDDHGYPWWRRRSKERDRRSFGEVYARGFDGGPHQSESERGSGGGEAQAEGRRTEAGAAVLRRRYILF
ncbi:hypothetical protein E2562_010795 [Oryza meyeriana var. granulata]|uniref:Uncharacterized protein n=1 Tax=Oryza meyeriana var. granulata TaxID=110450 RepID=A0A6G1BJI5_9ORYZ|nr:hypothetical protein E2562_010795 [Oryza meyeriana var. granulata]